MTYETFQKNVRKRNLLILKRRRRGESCRGIAEHFNVSLSLVGFILQDFAKEELVKARCEQLLAAIQQANDLHRPWPVDDLIDMIRPLPMTRAYLKKHFTELRTTELSLQVLVEIAIPLPEKADNAAILLCPLLRVYGVGKKGFWSVVNQLTKLDLGGAFNEEWNRRLAILRREWKITGKFPYA